MARESILWQRLNAEGGVPSNPEERGWNNAIGEALILVNRYHEPLVDALREIAAGSGRASNVARAALLLTDERLDRQFLVGAAPADEIDRLQAENTRLRAELADLKAQRHVEVV